MQGDIRALLALLVDFGVTPDSLTEPTSTAAVAAQLYAGLEPCRLARMAPNASPHPPPSDTTGTLKLSPLGLMDEVQPEIGDDAEGRGFLVAGSHR